MTTTQTISLEQLITREIADFFAGFVEVHTELGGPNTVEEAQAQLTERVLAVLAAVDSEPVAWACGDSLFFPSACAEQAKHIAASRGEICIPLYAAPPAPVAVPDNCVIINKGLIHRLLQPSETSSSGFKVCMSDDAMQAAKDIFNACRAAMLKADGTLTNEGTMQAEPVTAATVPDGWKMVPVEPTEAMLDAAYSHPASTEDRMRKQYASMLAAAPAAPEQEV